MSYTPFNAPLLSGLLGDMEIASFFSVKADLDAMLRFEVELAHAEAEAGVIPADAAQQIAKAAETFEPDIRALSEATMRDGMTVPEFVRQLRAAVGAPADQHVHFGSTSQDVIDTSLVWRLRKADAVLMRRLNGVVSLLDGLADRFGANPLMAYTRMQAALPMSVGDRISNWVAPLRSHSKETSCPSDVQFGGPVGTLDKLEAAGPTVRQSLAHRLKLTDPGRAWHTDRSALVSYLNRLSLVTGALGKIGLDITLMAQDERTTLTLNDVGGSSAMPHKQNPVKAEALVTLARFNATQVAGMQQTLLHEQERSGASWSLEWMLLPPVVVATGAALRNAKQLLNAIEELCGTVDR